MDFLRVSTRSLGMAGLLVALATSARGGAMYTVTDVGSATRPQPQYFNLEGVHLLGISPSGLVSEVPDRFGDTRIPVGMAVADNLSLHTSPDGRITVGTAYANTTSLSPWSGYVLRDGIASPLLPTDPTGTTFSGAFGVNDAGFVVGERGTNVPFASHAIVVGPDKKVTDLGGLGGSLNVALGLNNRGMVVGEGTTASGSFHAFVSDGRTMTDLNSLITPIPDFQLVSATGINDAGQIAAYGHFNGDPDWLYNEVLLSPSDSDVNGVPPTPYPGTGPTLPQPTPIPEPSTLAIFVVLSLGAARRVTRLRRS